MLNTTLAVEGSKGGLLDYRACKTVYTSTTALHQLTLLFNMYLMSLYQG